jgi:vacuolar-type H+-ATPase subunit H
LVVLLARDGEIEEYEQKRDKEVEECRVRVDNPERRQTYSAEAHRVREKGPKNIQNYLERNERKQAD